MHYLYIIYSVGLDQYYLGEDKDPFKRVEQHNAEINESPAYQHQPWELKAVFEAPDRGSVVKAEAYFKNHESRKLIKDLIDQQQLERFPELKRVH